MKVSFHTLGCKLNFSETSTIARDFEKHGFERVKFGDEADVVFINSCTVTEFADKKCRQAIKKIHKKSPDAFIAVTGCYAQSDADKLAQIPGVDIVLGMDEKFKIFEHIKDFKKTTGTPPVYSCDTELITNFDTAFSSGDRTRSFLKVQDGCDYLCTYCKIPLVRGKSRNKSVSETVKDAEKIARQGFKEIILTGVNIGDFGRSTNENFFNLIQELDKVKGIERIRISSAEPNLLTDEIIEFCAVSSSFLPHYHIPLQSGSNKILALMKRRYKREKFADRIAKIKSIQPDAFIGVDVIVGFPGETDADFQETYDFLSGLDISFLHVFSYSERKGTEAAEMPDKNRRETIVKRSQKLHKLSEKKHRDFYNKQIGTIRPVLTESANIKGKMYGFTDNYIKIEIPYNADYQNEILNFKLISVNENGTMRADLIK